MMIKLYNGDCLKIMEQMSDASVDLIITSPPYNIKDFHANQNKYENYSGNDMNESAYQNWQINVLNEAYRILKHDGSMMYNHKVRISKGRAIHPLEWLLKTKFVFKQEIVWWQKKGANTDKIRFFPFSERIYWLTKDAKTKMCNQDNLQDVIELVPTHTRKQNLHPAVMPLELANILIKPFPQAKTILDMFMGSGTTGVASVNNNRDFIGIELDEAYFTNASQRIRNAKNNQQTDMFDFIGGR